MFREKNNFALAILFYLLVCVLSASAQSTGFTYQGSLNNSGLPANGNYDFEFKLFNALTGGTTTAPNQQALNVTVTDGVFTTVIDFTGFAFPGEDRFLEISVRPAGGSGFTTLTPRQKVNVTPQSIKSIFADSAVNANNAQFATNASQLGGIAANQFVQTNDSRLADSRNPLPGAPTYIQNRTSLQPGTTNFNISGNGTVGGTFTGNIVNATTQFNLDGSRILSNSGANNLFAGVGAGTLTTGSNNSFFGTNAGGSITTTNNNSFFGSHAGALTATNANSFFGSGAGLNNTSGGANVFFGFLSGDTNTTGSNNTFIGYNTDAGANNLSNASAFGFRAFVESSNSLVLGSVNGKNSATADTSVGIGTTAPDATLDIEAQLPSTAPNPATPNLRLTNFGRFSMIRARTSNGTRTVPIATLANDALLRISADGYTGSGFSTTGQATIDFVATENWSSTANGTEIRFSTTSNGATGDVNRMIIDENGFVGIGTNTPARRLDVDGFIRVGATTTTIGCVEDRDGTVIAGTCSSDLRFKKNVTPFGSVLSNFSKLRPVNYFWRVDEFADKRFGKNQSFGLIAQEVEEIFPELVATDEKGYKVINYSKLPLLTIQAVKEQQAQIEEQRVRIEQQSKQIEQLKSVICSLHPVLSVCSEEKK